MQLPGIIASLVAVTGAIVFLSQGDVQKRFAALSLGPIGPVGTMNTMSGKPLAAKPVKASLFGAAYSPDSFLAATGPVAAERVFGAVPKRSVPVMPQELVPLAVLDECALPPVAADALIRPVFVEGSGLASAIRLWTREDLARAVLFELRAFKKNYASGRVPQEFGRSLDMRMDIVDVVVTETAAPVHLVLQSKGHVGWNVQTAAGVRLAGVTVLSNGPTGIALPDASAPVTVVDAMTEVCGVATARPVTEDWEVLERWKLARDSAKPAEYREAFAAYDAWFAGAFGQGAAESAVMAAQADLVLVGPEPAEGAGPLDYLGIAGRPMAVSAPGHEIHAVADGEHAAMVEDRGQALLRAALGEPVDTLAPVAVEMTN